jgi:hypothetical protein
VQAARPRCEAFDLPDRFGQPLSSAELDEWQADVTRARGGLGLRRAPEEAAEGMAEAPLCVG